MSYIVFDLEWNQPADNKPSSERKLMFEIIEIGAVKLNDDLEIVSEFNELVRPVVYHQINWRTQKMLNLKKNELQSGDYFTKVCRRFFQWCGEDPIFCTWGSQDLTELQRNMDYFKMKPMGNGPLPYYNIQKLFGIKIGSEQQSMNLEAAVDRMEVEKDIPFHRAYSDAYYTAKIMKLIGKEYLEGSCSYDLYHIPASEKEEIHSFYHNENLFISKGYPERTDITENRKIMQINCALCGGRALRQKIRWFSTATRIYYGAAICEKHGPIKGRLKIKKENENCYYADKLLTYVTQEEIDQLRQKKISSKKRSIALEGVQEQQGTDQKAKRSSSKRKGKKDFL